VFYTEEELKELADKNKIKSEEHVDFMASKIWQGVSVQEAFIDFEIKEYKEMVKNEVKPLEEKGYFERI